MRPAQPGRRFTGFATVVCVVAAAGAAVGGSLWIAKGLAILVTNDQPDYTFEVAPACFAIAVAGIAHRRSQFNDRLSLLIGGMAVVALIAGAATSLIYIAAGDTDSFGLFMMVTFLAVMGLLLTVARTGESATPIPRLLGLLMIGAIPLGGALAAIDERLLEVPLVAVGVGWLVLAVDLVKATRADSEIPISSVAQAGP